MEGILSKTNLGWSISGWNEKYFILKDNLLMVPSEKKKENLPEFILPLSEVVDVKLAPPASFGEGFIWASKQYFDIFQKQGQRTTTHNFYASSKELADKWVTAIQNALKAMDLGQKKETTGTETEAPKRESDRTDYTKEELRKSQIQHMADFGENMQHLDNLKVNLPKAPNRKLPSRNRKPKPEALGAPQEASHPEESPIKSVPQDSPDRVLVDNVSFISFPQQESPASNIETKTNSAAQSQPHQNESEKPPSKPLPQPHSKSSHSAPSKPLPQPHQNESEKPPSKPLPQPHQNESEKPPSKPLPQPHQNESEKAPSKPLPQPHSKSNHSAPSKPLPQPHQNESEKAPSKPLPQPHQNENQTAPSKHRDNEHPASHKPGPTIQATQPSVKHQGSVSNLKSGKPTYPVPDFQNLKKTTDNHQSKKPAIGLKPTYPIPQNLKPTQN